MGARGVASYLNPDFMRIAHYFVEEKNRHIGEAICAGWGAERVSSHIGKPVPGALHLIAGLQFGALEILMQVRAAREDYVFFDRAYFDGGPGSNWLRVVPRAYQHHWVQDLPPARAEALRLESRLRAWRAAGRHIMVVPPSDAICRLFNLGDWEAQTLARLQRCTDRPVDVSRKGDPRPLAERLADCHAVVTWTSNVAVEAVCAGVPVFCSSESAARSVSGWLGSLEHDIERPTIAPARELWLRSLACGQWTLDEIAAGEAMAFLAGNARR